MTDVLALIPVSTVASETDADGRTVALRPKFISPRLLRLQRLMWEPHFRVNLEVTGAFLAEWVRGRFPRLDEPSAAM